MKHAIKFFGIIVIVAMTGFSFIGCGETGSSTVELVDMSKFAGTWVDSEDGTKMVLDEYEHANLTMLEDNVEVMKGSFLAYTNNQVNISITEVNGAIFGAMFGLSTSEWYTKWSLMTTVTNYLLENGVSQDGAAQATGALSELFQSSTGTYKLKGNTLTITMGGETSTYTRQ